jgi:acetyl-CoA carboxylase biotin carboxyl carrier protein
MTLTPEDIADIVALLDGSRFRELQLKTDRFSLTLSRHSDGGWVQEGALLQAASVLNPPVTPVIAAAAAAAATSGSIDLPSPLLGTFYRAPKPGAPPFIEIGSEVGPETVIGLIETMKLMNSVYAGVRGRVAEICVPDAQFVEQGVVLARIEPAR